MNEKIIINNFDGLPIKTVIDFLMTANTNNSETIIETKKVLYGAVIRYLNETNITPEERNICSIHSCLLAGGKIGPEYQSGLDILLEEHKQQKYLQPKDSYESAVKYYETFTLANWRMQQQVIASCAMDTLKLINKYGLNTVHPSKKCEGDSIFDF